MSRQPTVFSPQEVIKAIKNDKLTVVFKTISANAKSVYPKLQITGTPINQKAEVTRPLVISETAKNEDDPTMYISYPLFDPNAKDAEKSLYYAKATGRLKMITSSMQIDKINPDTAEMLRLLNKELPQIVCDAIDELPDEKKNKIRKTYYDKSIPIIKEIYDAEHCTDPVKAGTPKPNPDFKITLKFGFWNEEDKSRRMITLEDYDKKNTVEFKKNGKTFRKTTYEPYKYENEDGELVSVDENNACKALPPRTKFMKTRYVIEPVLSSKGISAKIVINYACVKLSSGDGECNDEDIEEITELEEGDEMGDNVSEVSNE